MSSELCKKVIGAPGAGTPDPGSPHLVLSSHLGAQGSGAGGQGSWTSEAPLRCWSWWRGQEAKATGAPPPPPVWVLAPGLPWIRWPRFPAGEAPGWGTKTHVSSLVGRTGCLQEGGKQGEGGRRQIPGPSRGSSRRDSLAGLAPVLSSSWWGLLGPSQGPPPRARRALSYPSPQPGLSWRLLLPLLIIFH